MQVHDLLNRAVADNPDRKAVWFDNHWITYRELGETSRRIASYLCGLGVGKGDRVILLLDNSSFYISSYFGILMAGAVAVGIDPDVNSNRLTYLLKDSGALCMISHRKFRKTIESALSESTSLIGLLLEENKPGDFNEKYQTLITGFDCLTDQNPKPVMVRSIDLDLAEIVYTSGSTGKPKGVMLTHLNLVSNMRSICSYLELTQHDRIMVILPFSYIYGKSLLLTHIMQEASLVIDNRFAYPNTILETMKKTDVTGFAGVPSTYMILLNRSIIRQMKFNKLRYITQAGGAMAPTIQKEVVEVFSPARLFIMYGATEAAPRLSYLDPELIFNKWGSIGRPVDNVDLMICDAEGNELPRGEIGEITARGSNIMKGYWKDREETNAVLKKGMYFTGDLGRQDDEGFFYVAGRVKDIIKVKGFRIGAREIEDTILEIDEVHETAVIGVDDPILGEAVLALIISKEEGWKDAEKIRLHLKTNLPPLKQPKYIEFRNSFPKNGSGKIMKAVLKESENRKRG